jgi:hypothetical protein
MRKTWRLLACTLLSVASSAFALAPEEEALVTAVEGLYAPGAPAGVPMAPTSGAPAGGGHRAGCGTALLMQAHDRWDNLSEEARTRLKPLMEPPGGATPEGVPAAPDSSWLTVETAHFKLHYRTTGVDAPPRADANNDRIPDYINNAAAYLEKAYAKQVTEMGFLPPPAAKETIYFKKLNHNGLTHPMPNKHTWIELNSDILAFTKSALGAHFDAKRVSPDPAGCQEGLLKAVCAHEFFHAVQMQYNWKLPRWWSEGTADWMGHHCFPESGFYLNNVGPHLEQPHVSLFAEGDFFEYSASLWPLFLSEQLGAHVIKNIWQGGASGVSGLEQALSANTGNLTDMYMNWMCYNAVRNYKDGARMPQAYMLPNSEYPAKLQPPSGREPQHFGANIWKMTPRRPGTLSIRVTPADRSVTQTRVITVDKETSTWTIARKRSQPDGSFDIEVGGFGDNISQVIVIVGGFSPGGKGRYSLDVDVK